MKNGSKKKIKRKMIIVWKWKKFETKQINLKFCQK